MLGFFYRSTFFCIIGRSLNILIQEEKKGKIKLLKDRSSFLVHSKRESSLIGKTLVSKTRYKGSNPFSPALIQRRKGRLVSIGRAFDLQSFG